MRTIFGREPAYWLSLVAGVIALLTATGLPLTIEQQGVLNAVVAAFFGALTAWRVKAESSVPALVGLGKALIALALAFNLKLSPDLQASLLIVVELVLTGLLVRPNVVAPVPAKVTPDGAYDVSSLPPRAV
ncbi:hypothetical protein JOF41_007389 [Saccharothrix coeruleofusca]|uniref:hypothetical protein n=1 Tax=Saccharothrix coeruleofusca TaxID=33919 RepID=UPI001AE1F7CE|nr:hypothetical protein [Saccharothrix coeruleofusca]MBP2341135.1 hypothetical protein [Saccharothrix coeruleofusca]